MAKKKKSAFKMPVVDWGKYRGKQIAVVNGKVIASGYRATQVFQQAKDKYPDKTGEEIILGTVPRHRIVAYY